MPSSHATLLATLERLEAGHINVGLYAAHIGVSELASAAQLDEATVQNLLADLIDDHEVIEWDPGAYRSRIGETVRALRTLRQRFARQDDDLRRAPILVEDVRVEFRPRRRPRRSSVRVDDAVPSAPIPPDVRDAFVRALPFSTVSGFQSRALNDIYRAGVTGNPRNEAFIVAGDTGAGKTEAFILPILLDLASEPDDVRRLPGVRAVLMYPRIRLARNQLARLLRYTRAFQAQGGPRVTIGIQNGEVRSGLADTKWTRTPDGQRLRVDLLEACLQPDCAGRYWVRADDPALESRCPTLTCDTCGHTIDTLVVTQAALRVCAPDLLLITDVSLSQWLTRPAYSHLWGLWAGPTRTVPPRYLVLDEIHLYEGLKGAHISRLIRRFQARTRLAFRSANDPREPVVIGVSATLRDERRFLAKLLDVPPGDTDRLSRLKVIKPHPDELELTEGRERYVFINPRGASPTAANPNYRVTDQTAAIQIVMCVMHNLKRDAAWRALAFFDSLNDLQQFSMNYSTPDHAAVWQGQRQGANDLALWRLRTRSGRPECRSVCSSGGQPLSTCQHFREGDCWVFAKTAGWDEPLRVAPPVFAGSQGNTGMYDLVPTSPSLEVGYDDDAVQLVYQHKAPRNAASFIQRRGRAGRDPNDSPIIVTLLWRYRRDDAFYFFRPEALFDPQFDDTPLNAGNFAVQRSHAILALFDFIAVKKRIDPDGLPAIPNFTNVGNEYFRPALIQSWRETKKKTGAPMIVATHRLTKQAIYFSGRALDAVRVDPTGGSLNIQGWLALNNDLLARVLDEPWQRLHVQFPAYLALGDIVTAGFRAHRTFPFGLQPALIAEFGRREYHTANQGSNLIASFRQVDWMLQGQEQATTIPVEFPTGDVAAPSSEEILLSYGVTELLPGNVSYRLRQGNTAYWTPVPRNGTSSFTYPQVLNEETGEVTPDERFAPTITDVAAHQGSIYGVPRYLNDRFPKLQVMHLRRVRAEKYSTPPGQAWFFIPDASGLDGHTELRPTAGPHPDGAFAVTTRSSVRANSVIIPHLPRDVRPERLQILPPLSTLFAGITGYLDEGRATLGYTRAYYEMTIDLKGAASGEGRTLVRRFYPPAPLIVHGVPEAVLLGYEVQTHGLHFDVNPTFLATCVDAVQRNEALRLRLRHQYVLYYMTANAEAYGEYPATVTSYAAVATDYWLGQIVPTSTGEPRTLGHADVAPIVVHYTRTRIAQRTEIERLGTFLAEHGTFLDDLNVVLNSGYRDTEAFAAFVQSVILHSLTSVLKTHVARLAGVSSSELVAYADLPIMDRVDTTVFPRVLIMDTVEGGSGGIAQAFERLDLSAGTGSLAWTLQHDLGYCPYGTSEALLRELTRRTTPDTLRRTQASGKEEQLRALLATLGLDATTAETYQGLARNVFRDVLLGGRSGALVPILVIQELQRLQDHLAGSVVGGVTREAAVRHAALNPDAVARPEVERLRAALATSGAAGVDVTHELQVQLLALFHQVCEDGCPVCMSGESDMEHYHLAPFLNSRMVLAQLKEVLLADAPRVTDLQRAFSVLQEAGVARVADDLQDLNVDLPVEIGVQSVPLVDSLGQVQSSYTIVTDPDKFTVARQFHEDYRRHSVPNGPKVRSLSELSIAIQFQAAGFEYTYEPELKYEFNGEEGIILPDFYLSKYNLYIEFWGLTTEEYLISRAKKQRIYSLLGIEVINIEPDDLPHERYMGKIMDRIDEAQ